MSFFTMGGAIDSPSMLTRHNSAPSAVFKQITSPLRPASQKDQDQFPNVYGKPQIGTSLRAYEVESGLVDLNYLNVNKFAAR